MVAQAVATTTHVSAIASSAFRMKHQPQPQPKYQLTYDSLVTLWENEPAVTLHKLFNISSDVPMHDKVEIIKAGTGMFFFLFFFPTQY